mmetsp:Transcript_126488/g.252729  ORF Transcript_126488/g.252729 Transcript_126488/m.252729 type:complete len:749 (+) Transcript_126488:49-2295(+)
MVRGQVWVLAFATMLACAAGTAQQVASHEQTLARTWERSLDSNHAGTTPVTRVVNLLKEMQHTLKKEMDEDEDLYHKLGCWCNDNEYEKEGAISASEAKIAELESTIESLTAKIEELKTSLKELDEQLAADKKALAEATAIREKEATAFHGGELDSIQALENLKAALVVLAKHHDKAPESSVAGGAIFKTEQDSWASFLEVKSSKRWGFDHDQHALDDFMRRSDLDVGAPTLAVDDTQAANGGFLQQASPLRVDGWTLEDTALVKRAMRSATAFVQAHQSESYNPAYTAQSGEIVGILKQLKEEMEGDLKDSQEKEKDAAAAFAELRALKTQAIESAEKMSERKEDDLATSENGLAEAKEDLGEEKEALAEAQKFLKNLKETCTDADKKFAERKAARMNEITAVSETIGILTEDEARDAMSGTYNFLQRTATSARGKSRRQRAARTLRAAAKRNGDAQLSLLATSVELDAFTKVKKAIDGMVAMLKKQQEDEVKKVGYCKKTLQANEMDIEKTTDEKADLESEASKLSEDLKAIVDGLAEAKAQIAKLHVDLQSASEDRMSTNIAFQKTMADQTLTVKVLQVALARMAKYYDDESLLQKHALAAARQTPPVPQMEYTKSKAAGGVMQLLEKLIQDAKEIIEDSKAGEMEAQAAYEQTVADTNDSVDALQDKVATKSKQKAHTSKALLETEESIADTANEIEELQKYNADLHVECDYVLKNFDVRQKARAEEIEALQQATQILSGANFS